jgi:hypothetical protein
MSFLVELESPSGENFYLGVRDFKVADKADAIRFTNERAANGAAIAAIHGDQKAFWNSERESAKRHAAKMRGWKARVHLAS